VAEIHRQVPLNAGLALLKWDLQWIFEADDLTRFYTSFSVDQV
jgi:hypothetical protein